MYGFFRWLRKPKIFAHNSIRVVFLRFSILYSCLWPLYCFYNCIQNLDYYLFCPKKSCVFGISRTLMRNSFKMSPVNQWTVLRCYHWVEWQIERFSVGNRFRAIRSSVLCWNMCTILFILLLFEHLVSNLDFFIIINHRPPFITTSWKIQYTATLPLSSYGWWVNVSDVSNFWAIWNPFSTWDYLSSSFSHHTYSSSQCVLVITLNFMVVFKIEPIILLQHRSNVHKNKIDGSSTWNKI